MPKDLVTQFDDLIEALREAIAAVGEDADTWDLACQKLADALQMESDQ